MNLSDHNPIGILDIAADIFSVELELTQASLIGEIFKIEKTDDHIFVLESNGPRLLQFSKNGKFIKSIGKEGNGPREYKRLITFTVNPEERLIYLASFNEVSVYTFENKFVKKLKGFGLPQFISYAQSRLLIFSNQIEGDKNDIKLTSLLYALDKTLHVDTVKLKSIKLNKVVGTFYPKSKYMSYTENGLFLYIPTLIPEETIRDTLYSLEENGFKYALDLNLSNLTRPGEPKLINITSITKSDRYIFTEYLHDNSPKLFLYDFKQKKGYNMRHGILWRGDLGESSTIELFPLPRVLDNFYFITKESSSSTTEEPNPSIHFVSLKK